jgi:hypothetical protein
MPPVESSSRVIKRKFRRASAAKDLIERLDEACLAGSTLKDLASIVKSHASSPAKSPPVYPKNFISF